MMVVARQFSVVVAAGLLGLVSALALGSISGSLLSSNPTLIALRFFSAGLMSAGFTLWIILRRDEAGKPGFNPLLGLLLAAGILVLTLRLLYANENWTAYFDWVGLGLTLGSLALGLLAAIFLPASPHPLTTRWPGGESQTASHTSTHEQH